MDEREQKNKVFATDSTEDVPVPRQVVVQPQPQPQRHELSLEIPTEIVPLPSNGVAYAPPHPFHRQDMVEIKAMTAKEEDILTSRALLKKGTVITELIKSCLVNRNVEPTTLLAGDRNALMIAIRITGYGAEYDAEIECPECEAKSKHVFDLTALPVKRLELEPTSVGVNEFMFLLPYTKKRVAFKFMTGADEEEIMVMKDRQKKLGMRNDAVVTTQLLHSIISIDGINDRSKIATFVKSMPARDSLALRNYIKDNEPGIMMTQECACESCGHVEEVSMPIGVSFLWPNVGR
jgi:hypothetical protein